MGKDGRELSHHDLVSLLQKSAVAQARRGQREFTQEELLAAADELGIDRDVVLDVAASHLAGRSVEPTAPRPFDTRIEVKANAETLELDVPPIRFAPRHAVALGFSGCWFAALSAFPISGSANAALTIPFWAIGVASTVLTVLPLFQATRLRLDGETATLERHPFGRRRRFRIANLGVRIGSPVMSHDSGRAADRAVLLEYGTKTYPLLYGYSDQEQRWVESELRTWLKS